MAALAALSGLVWCGKPKTQCNKSGQHLAFSCGCGVTHARFPPLPVCAVWGGWAAEVMAVKVGRFWAAERAAVKVGRLGG